MKLYSLWYEAGMCGYGSSETQHADPAPLIEKAKSMCDADGLTWDADNMRSVETDLCGGHLVWIETHDIDPTTERNIYDVLHTLARMEPKTPEIWRLLVNRWRLPEFAEYMDTARQAGISIPTD